MQQLYTIKEVAKLTKVTVQCLYKWKNEGKIKFSYFAGKPRITESELKRVLKEDK